MEEVTMELVMGIDVGTQGVRVLVVDRRGEPIAQANRPLPPSKTGLPVGWSEQLPQDWWAATRTALLDATSQLKASGYRPEHLIAVAVDSTSGTVLPVDAAGRPLHAALMYNDSRSTPLVAEIHRVAHELEEKLGYAFKDSFALPKIVWLCRQDPTLLERTATFIHAADYITGRLMGDFRVTDHSNALKTGFDLVDYCWPELIERDLGIPLEKFPRVVAPGEPIGRVSAWAASETGLSTRTQVVAGMTDGSAAQLASGATAVGAWNSVLGTTLVIKGITDRLIRDPLGRVYCHLHPQGTWMPGGASNTGAEWIVHDYPGQDPAQLDAAALPYLPTTVISYPLARRGERFPFVAPDAQRFMEGTPADDIERYASQLEGLAYLERLAFETLEQLGAEVGETLFVTGGGSRSTTWSKVRATVLGRQLRRPVIAETAMGAALLAASHTLYRDLGEASREMVRIADTFDPQATWKQAYEDGYQRFVEACNARGYLP